ncbi:hypothetical protein [Micrococcus luteus]|uniref:hypothetical protein n=1 Tax=Micrococcus luteus TaxID=1270 RepID=UPI0023044F43|nr:hypothetical protein [Micrococcus luteus]
MRDPREILARIRAQADDATEGPWTAEYSGEQGNCVLPPEYQSTRETVAVTRLLSAQADAEFIAASRTTVPALLDALDAAIRVHHLSEFHTFTGPVPWCDECDCTYPCPTVDAITTALEGLHHA